MKQKYKINRYGNKAPLHNDKGDQIKFHYKAYIQENRPNQPKEEEEIEY